MQTFISLLMLGTGTFVISNFLATVRKHEGHQSRNPSVTNINQAIGSLLSIFGTSLYRRDTESLPDKTD